MRRRASTSRRGPQADEAKKDDALIADFDAAQAVVALGRAARNASPRSGAPAPAAASRARRPTGAATGAVTRLEAHILEGAEHQAAGTRGRGRRTGRLPDPGRTFRDSAGGTAGSSPPIRAAPRGGAGRDAPDDRAGGCERARATGSRPAGEALDLEAEDFPRREHLRGGLLLGRGPAATLVGLDTRLDDTLRREGLARELGAHASRRRASRRGSRYRTGSGSASSARRRSRPPSRSTAHT